MSDIVRQGEQDAACGQGALGEAEARKELHGNSQCSLDPLPVVFEGGDVLGGEGINAEHDAGSVGDHPTRSEDVVLGEYESLAHGVEVVHKPVDCRSGVQLGELGGGDRQQQIGLGENCAAGVRPDEDLQDPVDGGGVVLERTGNGDDDHPLVRPDEETYGWVYLAKEEADGRAAVHDAGAA